MNETKNFRDMLNETGKIVYTTRGVSMRPLLKQGRDVVYIVKRPEGRLKLCDAVLFVRDNGQYVLHRILKLTENGYWIIGDNCVGGEYVREEQVIGVLSAVVRRGKTVKSDNRFYRLYVRLWCRPWRMRAFILRILHFGMRCVRKTIRILKGETK